MNTTRSLLDSIGLIPKGAIVIYSLDLLKIMGTKVAADIIAENHNCNEQKLWRHVILNAFEDARIMTTDRKSSIYKCDAHFWIAASKDFNQICWWAGWDPDEVRTRYRKALLKEFIRFKRKHLLWNEYYSLYLRLKEEKDPAIRKELRRNVENKRKQIMYADNVFVKNFLKDLNI
jgi:hypothetical protein